MVDVHTTAATLMAVLCAVVSLDMSWTLMEWLAMVQAASHCVFMHSHLSDLEQTLMSVQSTAVAVSSSVPMKLEAFSVVAALGMS